MNPAYIAALRKMEALLERLFLGDPLKVDLNVLPRLEKPAATLFDGCLFPRGNDLALVVHRVGWDWSDFHRALNGAQYADTASVEGLRLTLSRLWETRGHWEKLADNLESEHG